MLAAIDIGGTKTRLVLADSPQNIMEDAVFATPEDKTTFLPLLVDGFSKLINGQQIGAIGVACRGPIDRQAGTWLDIPIAAELKKHFNCPVAFEHDATAGGIAEAVLGAAKDARIVLYLTISTGVGTAIIVGGKPLPSRYNSQGGHQIIQSHPFPGKSLEEFVSGQAIKQRYGKIARDIHDPNTWQTITQDLAIGLYNLVVIVQPDAVVIAGGVATHYDRFHQALEDNLAKLKPLYPLPPIKAAEFIETAPAIGALLLAQDLT